MLVRSAPGSISPSFHPHILRQRFLAPKAQQDRRSRTQRHSLDASEVNEHSYRRHQRISKRPSTRRKRPTHRPAPRERERELPSHRIAYHACVHYRPSSMGSCRWDDRHQSLRSIYGRHLALQGLSECLPPYVPHEGRAESRFCCYFRGRTNPSSETHCHRGKIQALGSLTSQERAEPSYHGLEQVASIESCLSINSNISFVAQSPVHTPNAYLSASSLSDRYSSVTSIVLIALRNCTSDLASHA